MPSPIVLLSLLFFLSGAAGLFYESIWARYLGLFVGHDAYGQITVLIIFLGGMAVGAAAVSRYTTRLRSPLLGYAVVELIVAALGLIFHPVYLALTDYAYLSLYPALEGSWALPLAKWLLAGALILPQSVLLGATFPLMTAGALRLSRRPPGRLLGQLYFANSLGAALGVLVAGFYLVARFGLPGTLRAAALLNLIARRGRQWITPDELRDGAVVARLKLGDPARARRLFRTLAPLSARGEGSLQSRLLEAHIRSAEAGGGGR